MARKLPILLALAAACGCGQSARDLCKNIILPEQRTIDYRDPSQLPPSRIPANAPPRTVSDPRPGTEEWQLSLDEAIRIALENANVIRILAGTTAVSSGQTIYDAAITNTTIDQAQATFDPVAHWNNTWSRTNTPMAEIKSDQPPGSSPSSPARLRSAYMTDFGLTKMNVLGGQWSVDATATDTRFVPLLQRFVQLSLVCWQRPVRQQ